MYLWSSTSASGAQKMLNAKVNIEVSIAEI